MIKKKNLLNTLKKKIECEFVEIIPSRFNYKIFLLRRSVKNNFDSKKKQHEKRSSNTVLCRKSNIINFIFKRKKLMQKNSNY